MRARRKPRRGRVRAWRVGAASDFGPRPRTDASDLVGNRLDGLHQRLLAVRRCRRLAALDLASAAHIGLGPGCGTEITTVRCATHCSMLCAAGAGERAGTEVSTGVCVGQGGGCDGPPPCACTAPGSPRRARRRQSGQTSRPSATRVRRRREGPRTAGGAGRVWPSGTLAKKKAAAAEAEARRGLFWPKSFSRC